MNTEQRQAGQKHLLIDIGMAAALLVALGVVFGIDRWTGTSPPKHSDAEELTVIEHLPGNKNSPPHAMRLGVTPQRNSLDIHVYDDMGKLLDSLGEGYKYTSFNPNDLRDIRMLEPYSIIFLTCSTMPSEWLDLEHPLGAGDRPGTKSFPPNEQVFDQMKVALRDWVEQGGTLYVSDKHFGLVDRAFPEFIDKSTIDSPSAQEVEADVVESGLKELIGPTIRLKFDLPGWQPAAFRDEMVTTYLKGSYHTDEADGKKNAPLLVKFPVKNGNVIFTSFHNEKLNSETAIKLLRYLVFTTVTAKIEAEIEKTMQFAPQKRSLLSSTPDNPTATQIYHKDRAGSVQIALGFANAGATLKLTIVAPNGKQFSKQLPSSLVVEIADENAPSGDWQITVEALKVPYPNFPFSVTVGQK